MSATPCSKHTPSPTGYLAWHEWAEKKSRTHVQIECPDCGLLCIWVPKKSRPSPAEEPSR